MTDRTPRRRMRRALPLALALGALLTIGQATAVAAPKKGGPKGGSSALQFGGYTWDVKTSSGPMGPGPNVFDRRNAFVDGAGNLHLTIRKRKGRWTTGEVVLRDPVGYGTYSFDVETPVADLDPNVILGMFTYSHDPAQNHREIDIEIGQFGDPGAPDVHYVVQPHTTPGQVERWELTEQGPTQHQFTWSPSGVDFFSSAGAQELHSWSFTDATATPDAGDAQARINLWLFGGNPPTDGNAVEVVLSNFSHTPG